MSLIGREFYESAALLRLLALDEYAPESPEPGDLAVAGVVAERTEPPEPSERPLR